MMMVNKCSEDYVFGSAKGLLMQHSCILHRFIRLTWLTATWRPFTDAAFVRVRSAAAGYAAGYFA